MINAKLKKQAKQVRKWLGDYYRFVEKWLKNRAVARNLINLSEYPLSYYSVLKNDAIPESKVFEQLESGDIIIVRDLLNQLNIAAEMESIVETYFDVTLSELVNVHRTTSIDSLVSRAWKIRSAMSLLTLQSSVLKRLISPHQSTAYIEMEPNMRIHVPYTAVKGHETAIEAKLGRGKINPHGQHKDSWRYHPQNTVNVWLALTDANPFNGMSILPGSLNYHPKFSTKLREIEEQVKTYPSQHWVTDLRAGDAIIFSAELLHGSVINMTARTRACLSMRFTRDEPVFHKKTSPNYMKVTQTGFSNMTWSKLRTGNFYPESCDVIYPPLEKLGTSLRPLQVTESQIKLNINGKIKCFPRFCPHAGKDLLTGELDSNGDLLCPAHRMSFKGKEC